MHKFYTSFCRSNLISCERVATDAWQSQFYTSFWRSNLISCETVAPEVWKTQFYFNFYKDAEPSLDWFSGNSIAVELSCDIEKQICKFSCNDDGTAGCRPEDQNQKGSYTFFSDAKQNMRWAARKLELPACVEVLVVEFVDGTCASVAAGLRHRSRFSLPKRVQVGLPKIWGSKPIPKYHGIPRVINTNQAFDLGLPAVLSVVRRRSWWERTPQTNVEFATTYSNRFWRCTFVFVWNLQCNSSFQTAMFNRTPLGPRQFMTCVTFCVSLECHI